MQRKRMLWGRKMTAILFCLMLPLSGCGANRPEEKEIVNISVWTYYNGQQLTAFNALVTEFNETIGAEEGIYVTSDHLGSVTDLVDTVMDSALGRVGANPMPNIFAAYADTAFQVDEMGLLADLSPYLSEEERGRFYENYLEEGRFSEDGTLKIFPIAKSVEVFLLNRTDWEPFALATGASYDDLRTVEGVTRVAQQYYEWTDEKTPEPNDGSAFFGRDAMANYFLIGAMQLGVEIIQVQDGNPEIHFDKNVVRKLWDNYYVPFIKGYFAASGRFRSDDVKTGNIISLVGSSSGATYFPEEVVIDDTEIHPVEMEVLPCPQFAGGRPYAVQQGAGMVVTNASEEQVEASITFLKWFTEEENNLRFSVDSGYMPVTMAANNMETISAYRGDQNDRMNQILTVSVDTVNENTLYTPRACTGGTEIRNVLESCMSDVAAQDRLTVQERLAEGATLEEACEEFLTDEYFDTWYEAILARLKELAG